RHAAPTSRTSALSLHDALPICTGFVGKVSLSMLLHRYGEALDKVWVLVRKGSSPSAEARFFDKIVTSEPFQPLRDKYQSGAADLDRKSTRLNSSHLVNSYAAFC